MLGAAPAMAVTVTMNTVQIFGTIDPAKISDYTDYMAAVNPKLSSTTFDRVPFLPRSSAK